MTAPNILCIVIVSFIISKADSTEKQVLDTECTKTVSYRRLENVNSRGDEGGNSSTNEISSNPKNKYNLVTVVERICCSGYEKKNGTCKPRCLPSCENGYCAQPNICTCNSGYEPIIQGNVTICKRICEEPCESTPANVTTITENRETEDLIEKTNCTQSCISGNCTATTCQEFTCNDGYQWSVNGTCDPICERPCINGKCVAPDTCTCDDGYEVNNESDFICEPVCSETCSFGNCIAPDFCSCDGGWGGKSCSEAILCVVVQPVNLNSTEIENTLPKSNDTEVATEKSRINQEPPACRPECFDQLGSISVNFSRNTSDSIHHFIRIDSPCNIVPPEFGFWSNYRILIRALIGIVLFAVLIYAAYIVARKLTRKNRLKSASMQCLYTDYLVINSIGEEN